MVSLKRKLEIHCKCEDSAELNVLVSDVISLKERKTWSYLHQDNCINQTSRMSYSSFPIAEQFNLKDNELGICKGDRSIALVIE